MYRKKTIFEKVIDVVLSVGLALLVISAALILAAFAFQVWTGRLCGSVMF